MKKLFVGVAIAGMLSAGMFATALAPVYESFSDGINDVTLNGNAGTDSTGFAVAANWITSPTLTEPIFSTNTAFFVAPQYPAGVAFTYPANISYANNDLERLDNGFRSALRDLDAANFIDLGVDRDYYLSFLYRSAEGSCGTFVGVTDGAGATIEVGNDNSYGNLWRIQGLSGAINGASAQATNTNYMLLVKIAAKAAGNDQVFLKAYSPTGAVSPTPDALTGQGTAAGQWTTISPVFQSSASLTKLVMSFRTNQAPTNAKSNSVDEIRLGTSWQDVAGVTSGAAVMTPAYNGAVPTPCVIDTYVAAPNSAGTVEIYEGAVKLGDATLLPGGDATSGTWRFTWTGAPVGAHTVSAKVTDSLSNVSMSPNQPFLAVLPQRADWFVVNADLGAGTADGSSWANATSLTAALISANYWGGGRVFLAQGAYPVATALAVTTSVQIYGGFAGTEPEAGAPGNRSLTFLADSPTTLTGGGANRLINISAGGAVVLDGLGLTNGYTTALGGSAVLATGAGTNLIMANCAIYSNVASGSGGAVRCETGTQITMTACVATSNVALNASGGAVLFNVSTATLSGCAFNSNTATSSGGRGGAIYSVATALTVDQCSFFGNAAFANAAEGGGAIFVQNTAPIQPIAISRTDFTSNSTAFNGGAMNYFGNATLTSCNFLYNSSLKDVGAIRINFPGSLIATDCRFERNRSGASGGSVMVRNSDCATTYIGCLFLANEAVGNGGALWQWNSGTSGANSQLTAINTVFDGNKAGADGGAIYSYANTQGVRLINCTLINNRAGGANGLDGVELDSAAGATRNLFLNCIFDGHRLAIHARAAGVQSSVSNCLTGFNGANAIMFSQVLQSVVADPAFVNAAVGDYHLQNYSSAIGAGAASGAGLTAPATDYDGTVRGTPVDIGAYENALDAPTPAPAVDVRYAKVGGLGDGSSWLNAATLDNAIANVSTDGIVFVSNETHLITQTIVIGKPMSIYGGCIVDVTTTATIGAPNGRPAGFMDSPTTVSAQGLYRAFSAQNIAYLVLDGVNVADGYVAGNGAGLYCNTANALTIRNAAFVNNKAAVIVVAAGGALCTSNVTALTIENTKFFNNSASGNFTGTGAGAIYGDGVSATALTSCSITSNTSNYLGGAVRFTNMGFVTMTGCSASDNWGPNQGGFMYLETSGGFTGTNNTFFNNYATGAVNGGAISVGGNNSAAVSLTNCNFTSNSAVGGGAFAMSGGTPLTMTQCAFANNHGTGSGGAISNSSAAFTMTSCTVTGNYSTANTGGAVYNSTGNGMTANGCDFFNNYTVGASNGGGIYTNSGALTLNGCNFTSHCAWQQGAAVQASGALNINGSTFTGNWTRDGLYTGGGGGAVYGNSASTVNLVNSTFTGNLGRMGGAFRAYGGTHTVNITGCVFDSNQSAHGGGALFFPNNTITVNVSNCVFRNNLAGFFSVNNGGAINTDTAPIPTLSNCLFYNNRASGLGGAISTGATAGLKVKSCTFSNNTAVTAGADCIAWANTTPANNVVLDSVFAGHRIAIYCATDGAKGSVYNSAFDNQMGNAVVNGAIINCVNGGVAFVNPAANDYHLQDSSVAIGVGTMTAGGQTAPATDFDGVARPLPIGSNPDAGAYENILKGTPDALPPTPASPTVYVSATGAGLMDGSSWDNATTLATALSIVSPDGRIFMKGGAGETHLVPTSFTLSKGMSIFGGFAGIAGEDDPSTRPADYLTNYPTTIDGQNLYRPLGFSNAKAVELDALNFVNGLASSANGGGAVCVEYSTSFTARDCSFNNNVSLAESGALRIAGIWAPFTLARCTFTSNTSRGGRGGGLAVGSSTGLIEDCLFTGNTAGYSGGNQRGGGISAQLYNGGTITIRRATITANNTWDDGGAGLQCYDGGAGATLVLEDCVISGNNQNDGSVGKDNYAAGIMMGATSGADTIKVIATNTSIDNNVGGYSGGSNNLAGGVGIHASVQAIFTNCSISGNRLTNNNSGDCYGAGIFMRDTTSASLTNCRILGNLCFNTGANGSSDQAYGGGLCLIDTPNLTMNGCRIEDNVSSTGTGGGATQPKGGGIFIRNNAMVKLTGCTLLRNKCVADLAAQYGAGGGIGIEAAANVTLTDCIMANNVSEYSGGGIRVADNVAVGLLLRVVNCTFYNNAVTNNGNGQGIYTANKITTAPAIVNCLFDGHSLEAVRAADNTITTSPLIYNCLFGNSGPNGNYVNAACLVNCQTGVASGMADPVNYDFDLLGSSPAIDNGLTQAGADAAFGVLGGAVTVPSLDIAGRARFYPAPGIPDIGAYELQQASVILTPDPFHFGIVDAGSSVTSTIAVANLGNVSYTFDAAKWAVTGAPFSVVAPFGGTLAAGATAPVVLGFAPAALGDFTGQLGYSDGVVSLSSVTLRGATPVSVISLARMDSDPTSVGAVRWLATFSQPVVNVDAADFDIVTTGSFAVAPAVQLVAPAGDTAIITVNTGSGEGQIQLIVNAGSDIAEATYLSLLANLPFAGDIYTLDNVAASVVSIIPVNAGIVSPTSASSVVYDVTFSEAVSGVAAANFALVAVDGFASGSIVSVTNAGGTASASVWQATVGNLASSNATGGYLRLDLSDAAGIADQFNNPLSATAIGGVIWVDLNGPVLDPTVRVEPTSGTTVGVVEVTTLTFSEPVTGVTLDKLTITTDGVTILSPTGLIVISPTQYAFTMDDVYGSGPVALNMTLYGTSDSTILDAAGNALATTQWSITKDASVVQVTIASAQVADGGLTSLTQVTFHASFLVDMTGFDPQSQPGDLLLTNCEYVPGSFVALTGTDYDFAVRPLGQGIATVRVPSNVGQTVTPPIRVNGISNLYTLNFDMQDPTFANVASAPARVQTGVNVTLTFTASEVLMADPLVSVNGNAATMLAKAGNDYTYSYLVAALDAEGPAAVSMTGTDLAGNTSTTVVTTALYVDKTAPIATIQSVSPDINALVTVDFNEDVTGVDAGDFSLTLNGTPITGIANFAQVNLRQYTFNVPNAAQGLYVLTLTATGSGIQDIAGIAMTADASATWAVAPGAASVRLWVRY